MNMQNRKISVLLVLLLTTTGFVVYGPKAGPVQKADHRWMLNDPRRSILSIGAERMLLDELQQWQSQGQNTVAPEASDHQNHQSHFDSVSYSQAINYPGGGNLDSFVVSSGTNRLVNNPATDTPDNTTQNETSIAVFGQRVVVGFNDSNSSTNNNYAGYAYSTDGGSNFTDAGNIPQQTGWRNFGDPVVAVDNKGNFFYATLIRNTSTNQQRIAVAKSADGGITFGTPVTATLGGEIEDNDFLDKQWIAVDQSTNEIYLVWSNFKPGGTTELQFTVSTNEGAGWSNARELRSVTTLGIIGAQVAVGVEGEIFVAWENVLNATNANIEFCQVPASGLCAAISVASNIPRAGTESECEQGRRRRVLNGHIRLLELPSMAVDYSTGPNRGAVYMVWNQASGTDQSEIFFSRRSPGDGQWTPPDEVKINSTDQFMPAVAVSSNDGMVAVMYYSRELDQQNNRLIDVYWSKSSDAGASFTHQIVTTTSFDVPPLRLGSSPNFTNFDSNFSACYMGEYNQVVSDGENFYMVWGDNRNTVNSPTLGMRPDPDVFFTAITPEPRNYFAHLADGGGWKTTFFMTNLDKASSSTVRLELFKSDGTAWAVLPGGVSSTTVTLQPSGATSIETIGGTASGGWARLTTTTTARAGFAAVSRFFQNNALQKELGWSPILPFKRGLFLIDRDTGTSTNTAVAIANQSETQSTDVTLTLRHENGTDFGSTTITNLAAKNHVARYINELFPSVPAQFKGSLLMESSATNIAASVRDDGTQNTNFPVFAGSFPTVSYFADVVNGGGWTTDFGFGNLSQTAGATVTIETLKDGNPWAVLPGGSSQTVSLQSKGSAFVETIGGATFERGWAKITATRSVGVFQVQQSFSGGQMATEAGDNSRLAKKFSHTFGINSPSASVNTGISVANPETVSTVVKFELWDSNGTFQGSTELTLSAKSQVARQLTDLFAVGTITGTLRITSTTAPVAARILRIDGAQLATYSVY